MNRIKTLAAGVMALASLWPFAARADLSMTVLRETYHVAGYVARGDYYEWGGDEFYLSMPGESRSYDVTAARAPASGSASIIADVPGDSLQARSLATCCQDDSDLLFHVEAFSTRLGPGGQYPPYSIGKDAYASLDVQFLLRGGDDHVHVTVEGDPLYSRGSGSLAGGGQSWSLFSGAFYDEESQPWWNAGDPIPFDTTQVYTLSMSVYPWAAGEGGGGRIVRFEDISHVSVVPLPGAALLALLGLGCAGRRLRRAGC